MNYEEMRELERQLKEERNVEYSLQHVERDIEYNGVVRTVRLARFVWAGFDLLIFSEIMPAHEIIAKSQLGVERYPDRTFEDNLSNFVLHAANDLRRFMD